MTVQVAIVILKQNLDTPSLTNWQEMMLTNHFRTDLHTTSTTPDTTAGGCGCCTGGPAGDGGGDHSGHCHHCGGHEEETQGLRTAAVAGGHCVHERRVQW